MQQCLSELEKLSEKALQYERVKEELEFSFAIIEKNRSEIVKAQSIEHSMSQYKA